MAVFSEQTEQPGDYRIIRPDCCTASDPVSPPQIMQMVSCAKIPSECLDIRAKLCYNTVK